MNFKPAGLPVAVVAYAVVLAVLGSYLGIVALIDPSTAVNYVVGADSIASAWAGRTLGLGLAMALAIFFRSAMAYAVAFLGCVFREFGDILGMLGTGETTIVAVLAVFLALDVIGLLFSLKAVGHGSLAESNGSA